MKRARLLLSALMLGTLALLVVPNAPVMAQSPMASPHPDILLKLGQAVLHVPLSPVLIAADPVVEAVMFWQDVERLYDAGFTSGCAQNPLRYCPTNNVTRAEMAVFLVRGIHGASYDPPPATGTVFADVPASHWAAEWIEKLYDDGITTGCGGDNYCPGSLVTHAQMAVFLLRSYYDASYTPPSAAGQTYFNDVSPSYWAADWIKQLAREGFSYGAYNCSPRNFCPDQAISRAEMASMLVRTFINFLP